MLKGIAVVLSIGLSAWAYKAITPPPSKICGSLGGPPVTAPRVTLRDGRHLAYKEHGVSREIAKSKVVYVHGFSSSRIDAIFVMNILPEVAEELSVHVVTFDRPGYGESDPHPQRTPESLAMDIEELADQLRLGSKFYVIGYSMGGQVLWGCLRYIPHRLAGAVLIAPVTNYWWTGIPANLSTEAYHLLLPQEQWTLRVSHYLPWLTYWWSGGGSPNVFSGLSRQDLEILSQRRKSPEAELQATQQGVFESLHRDLIVGFGKWGFDPMDLKNPFPNNEGSVHLWQGGEDKMVPAILQRYIAEKHDWIQYHELPDFGHLFPYIPVLSETIFKTLLLEKQ